jgi:hypothetical protein
MRSGWASCGGDAGRSHEDAVRSQEKAGSSGPKIRPWLGVRQRRRALGRRWRRFSWPGQEFAGVGVEGLDGDFAAEAFQALDVIADLAAGVHALFAVVGAEVLLTGFRVGEHPLHCIQQTPASAEPPRAAPVVRARGVAWPACQS